MIRPRSALVLTVASLAGCGHPTGSAGSASASAAAPALSALPSADAARIEAAEQHRASAEVSPEDLSSRNVGVRRAAARALARIITPGARTGLLRLLEDEDPTVVAWAAYGLGMNCDGAREEVVSALSARRVSLDVEVVSTAAGAQLPSAVELSPSEAIHRAIGRCAASSSEAALFAALGESRDHVRSAILGLGDLACDKKRLLEDTTASLLNFAAGTPSTPSIPEAFVPLSCLDNVSTNAIPRLIEVATAKLGEASSYRLYAIRALGRTKKPEARTPLEKVLAGDGSFSTEERVEAARSLGKLSGDGNRSLVNVLKKLAAEATADPSKVAAGGQPFDVLLSLLEAMVDAGDGKDALAGLAKLPVVDGASPSAKRREVLVRCAAARLLAGENSIDATLLACDPDQGAIGSRALVRVLDKADVVGPRLLQWNKLISSTDLVTREAALRLLADHEEIPDSAKTLLAALSAKENGMVATAAEVLKKSPSRAGDDAHRKKRKKKDKKKPEGDKDGDKKKEDEEPLPPSPEVVTAIGNALDRMAAVGDLEAVASVIDAIGALQIASLLSKLEVDCVSTYPPLRDHAAGALSMATGKKKTCPAVDSPGPTPPELSRPLPTQSTLVLDTDAGELRIQLDPDIAPVAVSRFVDLASAGFYDGTIIHRVDPSFVVQFGSPTADGFGGPDGRLPLRCETSPIPFETLSVGVALGGRDTGSSQLFVLRSRAPRLDGQYAIVGVASGKWEMVSEGDVIRKVRVE